MSGSLLCDGCNRNRVLSDVLAFDGDLLTPVSLQEIGVHLFPGVSPFESRPAAIITGLLAQGNSSITLAGVSVILEPCRFLSYAP
ncbi:uncharacterized protein THITE_2111012 [Thermothielavioides terrestris NRRL 8126]|jgi:hypothetical protein|uniref:Uncharacterized protein n=1 Tax=Thermothielavioides terrestris (strain ATCC 38088 / NRRL 8126) TaxID=578455 RepID=G2QVZ9_THETT|nr:uncharacterized protein THITE_2111012 [Thermothielavioides terrestris NRRL 8126]AEO64731.1 hypothetical protein THITE_2111012 [Thermothielavioides terrestris NRRL 8126]